MILEFYLTLLFLCIIIIITGKYISSPVLQIGSFTFLFILGLILLLGGVSYKTGTLETYNYICSVCGTPQNISYNCTGTPTPCDFYDGNPVSCLLYGCQYNESSTLCYDNPTQCNDYTNITTCTRAGCELDITITNATNSINETVVGSKITTNTYTNYDNEIIQNITIHHILGFIIAILGALGFMTALFNLKEDTIN